MTKSIKCLSNQNSSPYHVILEYKRYIYDCLSILTYASVYTESVADFFKVHMHTCRWIISGFCPG